MPTLAEVLKARHDFRSHDSKCVLPGENLLKALRRQEVMKNSARLADLIDFPLDTGGGTSVVAEDIFRQIGTRFGESGSSFFLRIEDVLGRSRTAAKGASTLVAERLAATPGPRAPEIHFLSGLIESATRLAEAGPLARHGTSLASFVLSGTLPWEEGAVALNATIEWAQAHHDAVVAGQEVERYLSRQGNWMVADRIFTLGAALWNQPPHILNPATYDRWRKTIFSGMDGMGGRFVNALRAMRTNPLAVGLTTAIVVGFGCLVYRKEPDTLRNT